MPTVLVVDDEPILRMLLTEVLEEEGYTVREAVDATALQVAVQEQPDLILLDLNLPDTDGVTIAAHLRQDERTRAIPIVVISVAVDLTARARAMGADAVLVKPFDLDEALACIRRLVG